MVSFERSSGEKADCMAPDSDERDEQIVSARIAGESTRALAKLHGCSSREVEEAVDRRLDYTLDNRQRRVW